MIGSMSRGGILYTLAEQAGSLYFALGGYMSEDPSSQGASTPIKSRMATHSLRPVTIKQLLEASTAANTDSIHIQVQGKDVDLGQVVFVACVRSLKESNTGADYVLEDGTGSISGKCWQDKAGVPVMYENRQFR